MAGQPRGELGSDGHFERAVKKIIADILTYEDVSPYAPLQYPGTSKKTIVNVLFLLAV